MRTLLELIKFNAKAITRDKAFITMSFLVMPIIFPMMMMAMAVGLAYSKDKAINDTSLMSKDHRVIGVILDDNNRSSDLSKLLSSKYGHQIISVDSLDELSEKIRAQEATYGFTVEENDDGRLNMSLMMDFQRHSTRSDFKKEIDGAIEAYEFLYSKELASNLGIDANTLNLVKKPISIKEANVSNTNSNQIKDLVTLIIYIMMYSPVLSSLKLVSHSISEEHSKKFSLMPLLSRSTLTEWIGSKIVLGCLWALVLSTFGMGAVMAAKAAALSNIGILQQAFPTLTEDSFIFTALSWGKLFQISIISAVGITMMLVMMSWIASLGKSHKSFSIYEGMITTLFLIILMLNEPFINSSPSIMYAVPVIGHKQMAFDILLGNANLINLATLVIGNLGLAAILMHLSKREYVNRAQSTEAYI